MAVGTAAAQLARDQHTLRKWATAPHARRTSLRGYRTPALRQGGLRIWGPSLKADPPVDSGSSTWARSPPQRHAPDARQGTQRPHCGRVGGGGFGGGGERGRRGILGGVGGGLREGGGLINGRKAGRGGGDGSSGSGSGGSGEGPGGSCSCSSYSHVSIFSNSQILKFFYSTNTHQHAHLLGPKSRAHALQPRTAAARTAARTRSGGRARTWRRQRRW